jgi:hypothetical protein
MSCGCGKPRQNDNVLFKTTLNSSNPTTWGPSIWTALHCIAEKIGNSNSPIIETDQVTTFKWLIEFLPSILPCKSCQSHSFQYISTHPVREWSSLNGYILKGTIRLWLINFHNSVRERNNVPIEITTLEECRLQYENCKVSPTFIEDLSRYISYAIQEGWVRLDNWKRWMVQFNKLMLLI